MIAEFAVPSSSAPVHEGRDSPVECGGDVDEIRDGLEEDLLEDHRLDGMPLEDRVHDHPTLRRRAGHDHGQRCARRRKGPFETELMAGSGGDVELVEYPLMCLDVRLDDVNLDRVVERAQQR